MARTLQDFINNVTGHLGNRSGGVIGNQTMAASVTASVNTALYKILKAYRIPAFERNLTVTTVSGTYLYDLPILDGSSNVVRIRSISTVRYGSTTVTSGIKLIKMSDALRDEKFPVIDTTVTGNPIYYTIFNNKFELYPIPNEAGTLYIRCDIWHNDMTLLTEYSPLGPEWDDAIEEFATADCFAKLQQTLDANLWMKNFKDTVRNTKYALTEEPDWSPTVFGSYRSSVNPINDPFVRSYN
jgi:hypothetical protein